MIEINLLPGTGKKPRSRSGAGHDRFFVRLPRLAQMHVQVDESRSDDQPAGIENLRIVSCHLAGFSDLGDEAIAQENIAFGIKALRGIDHAAIAEEQRSAEPRISADFRGLFVGIVSHLSPLSSRFHVLSNF
jgi:hypothetical protein